MALRVLLADESPTIKKVFQLALQDFAVEIKSVNIGLDVKHVAEEFRPDIVFADVLLQKQNGYEVCTELKSNNSTSELPVVLMWSGFMDLDEDKFKSSAADGRIEKPFDVQALRELVKTHVPKTTKQSLSDYLTFPTLPEIKDEEKAETKPEVESPSSVVKTSEENTSHQNSSNVISLGTPEHTTPKREANMDQPPPIPPKKESPSESANSWDMDSFDPISLSSHESDDDDLDESGFTAVSMIRKKSDSPVQTASESTETNEDWVSADISRFKLDEDLTKEEPLGFVLPEAEPEEKGVDLTSGDSSEYDFPSPMDTDDIDLENEPTFSGVSLSGTTDLQIEDVPDPDIYSPIDDEPIPGYKRREVSDSPRVNVTREDIEKVIYEACQKSLEDVLKEVIPEVAREIIQREVDKIVKN
tara:strand:- start:152157 stop:153404 length:1248 start_codon:yes stop_codon:yes gene_type:complete